MTENPLNMGVLLKKRVTLVCSTLRSRSLEYKHKLVQEVSVISKAYTYTCMYFVIWLWYFPPVC